MQNKNGEDRDWYEAFPFLVSNNAVVSIIGAGGKSSLMYQLAQLMVQNSKKVLVTTTTHIWKPEERAYGACLEDVKLLWGLRKYAVIGTPTEDGKLAHPEEVFWREASSQADIVLIEADGAKGYPCKIANQAEPIIDKLTTVVIVVVGIDAIGKSLNKGCFRYPLALNLLKKTEEQIIEVEDVARMVAKSVEDTKRICEVREYYVVINKCDDDGLMSKGKDLADKLKVLGVENIICTSIRNKILNVIVQGDRS